MKKFIGKAAKTMMMMGMCMCSMCMFCVKFFSNVLSITDTKTCFQ